jgi:tetratricopeptide (TPR) repeat protein
MLMHTHTIRHSPAPHHQSLITRTLKIDHKNLSPLDVEKELFKMKRQMGAYYSKAAYAEALKVAKELNREVLDIMGSGNTVHASCLNDIGLMEKMLGNKEAALEKYKESLAIYEETVGKSHMSYVSTSSNIGVLYKSMADSAQSEEEYWKYLDLAEDILKKSLAARIDLHGSTAKEVLVNQNHLANILRCKLFV